MKPQSEDERKFFEFLIRKYSSSEEVSDKGIKLNNKNIYI